jgi:hypothetical protein
VRIVEYNILPEDDKKRKEVKKQGKVDLRV